MLPLTRSSSAPFPELENVQKQIGKLNTLPSVTISDFSALSKSVETIIEEPPTPTLPYVTLEDCFNHSLKHSRIAQLQNNDTWSYTNYSSSCDSCDDPSTDAELDIVVSPNLNHIKPDQNQVGLHF